VTVTRKFRNKNFISLLEIRTVIKGVQQILLNGEVVQGYSSRDQLKEDNEVLVEM